MPVLSQPMNHNGAAYPMPMGYGAPMPQPSVHTVTQYGYQPSYHSPPGPGGMMGMGNGPVPPPPPVAQVPMSFHDQAELARKMRDYEALTQIITQWNANRLDLFALSLPNEHLEFNGVMRFYYQSQDSTNGQKVATKCIRVTSSATTKEIIETLIEKFRPDMRMLEVPEYALYEIHESGERRLGLDEKPLLVQLNWHKDDREGRFLLRRIDDVTHAGVMSASSTATTDSSNAVKEGPEFKRKLSKREKKEMKKQEKLNKVGKGKDGSPGKDGESSVAEKLYTELPDTSFTRSISNPEAVMRRRRQQKLEKKLIQFRSKDGGPDTGGTLKIYGEALCKEVPYKTLLLSVHDSAAQVVEEMLEKYGLDRKEAPAFCLVQMTNIHASTSNGTNGGGGGELAQVPREYYLEDEECPLAILMNHPPSRGSVTFHIRRKPADFHTRKRKKKPMMKDFASESALMTEDRLPFLLEMNPDGSDINRAQGRMPHRLRIAPNLTEIGSDPAIQGGQSLLLPFIYPRHCIIAHTEGVVTVTPSNQEAETYVNNKRIFQTTILQNGTIVRFGRNQCFRFIDPTFEERLHHQASSVTLPDAYANYAHFARLGAQTPMMQPQGRDHILPAVLEFREETEEIFFDEIMTSLDVNNVQFKLAPTYTLYMATRFRASTHYRTELIPEERAVRLTSMLNYVADQVYGVIDANQRDAGYLAFWMANASEFLHFLKSDRHITSFSHQAQDLLAEAVHLAFKHLVVCLQADLEMALPMLLYDGDDDIHSTDQTSPTTQGMLQVLQSAMGLLRKCRVNAALTIQLFSQLFHFINMWTFNRIIGYDQMPNHHMMPGEKPPNYCTHKWGLRLKKRLSRVEAWAEKQGLELAADCHLARVVQAAHLLLARKNTAEDIASVSSICFKLNSLQLKTLLHKYESSLDEKPISKEMIDTIVRVAENTVDEVTNAEGREVRLEEDFVLQLPFLLPEDGYSCDIVRGVPGGLTEFLAPLQRKGLCIMTPQPTSSGFWTIYMDNFLPPSATPVPRSPSEMSQINGTDLNNKQFAAKAGQPEVQKIRLIKSNQGMGLSIVAAKGIGKDRLGIYIKAVVEGGAAWHDGRLQAGDQLLQVDGHSLVGITQERAAEIMMQTGQIVELEVAKQGAIFHGLATLLSQPSPVMSRSNSTAPLPPLPSSNSRRVSERDFAMQPEIPLGQPSRSFQNLHEQQHTYQNHRPTYYGPGPPPVSQMHPHARHPSVPGPPMGPPQQGNMKSTSMQNLSTAPVPGRLPPGPPHINGRDAGHHDRISVGDDQGFYQNVGPNGTAQHLQQHMPLRYSGPPATPRFAGSQSSLQPGSPIGPVGYLDETGGRTEDLHHASPRIVGTPLSSGSMGSVPRPSQQQTPMMSPMGPEKPSRHYAYEAGPGPNHHGNTTGTRVRFQDSVDQPVHKVSTSSIGHHRPSTDSVSSQLEQLRMSSVEREFRRRVAQYEQQNKDESNSDSEGRHFGLTNGGPKVEQVERLRKLEAMEQKQRELDDTKRDEERLLHEAQRRRISENNGPNGLRSDNGTRTDLMTPPPPLPALPPPDTPPGRASSSVAAQRLDMLVVGKKSETPTKKVSFMSENESRFDDDEDDDENFKNGQDEKLSRLERVERDPNAFIKEAESLLNSTSMSFDKILDFKATGHTPSVIGTQEIYKDPRLKRMQKAEEEKATTGKRDGAKLSFKEKMLLFAAEAGENNPRDKAKISKAQRNIDGDGDGDYRFDE